MRLNSYRGAKILKLTYLLCGFVILFDLIMLNVEGSWGSFIKLSPLALLIFIFLIYRGYPHFLYDSDGEVLNFTAQEPNLGFWQNRFRRHIEFPKHRLHNFSFRKWPFNRKLILYVTRKDGSVIKQSMSVSYLSRQEVKDLRRSLKKVVDHNQENNGRREELFGKQ